MRTPLGSHRNLFANVLWNYEMQIATGLLEFLGAFFESAGMSRVEEDQGEDMSQASSTVYQTLNCEVQQNQHWSSLYSSSGASSPFHMCTLQEACRPFQVLRYTIYSSPSRLPNYNPMPKIRKKNLIERNATKQTLQRFIRHFLIILPSFPNCYTFFPSRPLHHLTFDSCAVRLN